MPDRIGIVDRVLETLERLAGRVVALETRPAARDGRDGAPGRDGSPGVIGVAGSPGECGQRGPQGESGPIGPPGPSGDYGILPPELAGEVAIAARMLHELPPITMGAADSGVEVLQSSEGAEGPQGPPGPAGPSGDRGEKGEPGRDGRDAADVALIRYFIAEQVSAQIADRLEKLGTK